MSLPVVVLFGSNQHQSMSLLYHFLQERKRCRPVFIANEAFPREPGLEYHLSDDGEDGCLYPWEEAPVPFENVVSVALDEFFVRPPDLELYPKEDQGYLQNEGWACLISLFAALSRRCLVANHITRRDDLSSRLALLATLSAHGIATPPVCVTSNEVQARAFLERHQGKVVSRPVAVRELPVRPVEEEAMSRLDRLQLCPVHFERQLEGEPVSVIKVGPALIFSQPIEGLPEEALHRVCETLSLELAEFTFRPDPQGSGWLCSGLQPFVRTAHFSNRALAERIAVLFEEGWQA